MVLVAFAAIFALGALMMSQVNQLASDLPSYQSTLREKIQSLRGATAATGTLERASDVLKDLSSEIDRPSSNQPGAQLGERALPTRPIPVEVKQPVPSALQTLVALITPLIHPLTTTGIVVIFVIFILLQRQDLRNRLVRLAGAQDRFPSFDARARTMQVTGNKGTALFNSILALTSNVSVSEELCPHRRSICVEQAKKRYRL